MHINSSLYPPNSIIFGHFQDVFPKILLESKVKLFPKSELNSLNSTMDEAHLSAHHFDPNLAKRTWFLEPFC